MALHREGDVAVAVTTARCLAGVGAGACRLVAAALPAEPGRGRRDVARGASRLHERGESTEGRDWPARVCALVAGAPDVDAGG